MSRLDQEKFKKHYLLILFFVGTIFLSACTGISSGPAGSQATILGIFKSEDKTSTWKLKDAVANTQGKLLYISDTSINKMVMDPSDHLALYLATNKGLFYSYDGAESWQQADFFGSSLINGIAVDYFNKCVIFIAKGNTIYKTTDCLRTFASVYIDGRSNVQINEVQTEHYNKNIVYAGTSTGDVLKSLDSGQNWQAVKRINNPVKQILVDKDDTRIVYIATESAGIFKTTDVGKTWGDSKPETDINQSLNSFPDSKVFYRLVQDLTKRNSFILASRYGLLRTTNGGLNWESIPLITPERSTEIYSLAIDPKDAKAIYYGTKTTIYKSTDGGKDWSTQKSPTSGIANYLLIDPQDSKIIYLGAKAIK